MKRWNGLFQRCGVHSMLLQGIRKFSGFTTKATSKRLDELSRKIFGSLPQTGIRTGLKILRKRPKGAWIADYYMDSVIPSHHEIGRSVIRGYMDVHQEWRKYKLQQLHRRGKGPPKKGQGKRSKKK
uniref:Small ribosomal subunit protein mS33 n=1 Tax=Aureoumbra lagunensis TaxID=44058 RepID=A0A7S3JU98_9STRA|mmetsp:Transcript_19537/g.25301  ORF Transcript_19537/g.25301 Transcript_19537/m.25301 type:complete len:126 (+) Transcript_19537:53-430(+)